MESAVNFFENTPLYQPGNKPVSKATLLHRHSWQPASDPQKYPGQDDPQKVENDQLIPQSEQEIRRLGFRHYFIRQILKNYHLAPISPLARNILDVGSSDGRWAQEMALAFPRATVINMSGTADQQVLIPGVGSNYHFVKSNIRERFPFSDEQFDMTHEHKLSMIVPARDIDAVFREMVRVTRSGGWIEMIESSDEVQNIGPLLKYVVAIKHAVIQSRGFALIPSYELEKQLSLYGVHNIHIRPVEQPLGPWLAGREREGTLVLQDGMAILKSIKSLACELGLINASDFDQIIEALPKECIRYRTMYRWYVLYGQRL